MRLFFSLALIGGVALALTQGLEASTAHAADKKAWVQPKTPWGDPDIQGMWPVTHLNGTPLQRDPKYGTQRYLTEKEFAERNAALKKRGGLYNEEIETNKIGLGHWAEFGEAQRMTSLIIDPPNGRLPPLTAKGEAESKTMRSSWSDIVFDGLEDFNVLDRCITRGLPASMFPFMYNSGIQIFQSPGYVAIRLEIIHETRIIPVDGRAHLPGEVREWLGNSVGHWEGNTLVVETTNFTGEVPMTIVGPRSKPIPTSKQLKVVERFTRTGEKTMDYQVTVTDPVVMKGSWTAYEPWQRDPTYRIYEYACHEGNETIRDYITAFRAEAAKKKAEK